MDSGRRRRKEKRKKKDKRDSWGLQEEKSREALEISWLWLLDLHHVSDQLSTRCRSLSAPLAGVSIKVRLPMGLFVPFQTFPIDQCCTRRT